VTVWDIKKGMLFISKGRARIVYRVVGLNRHTATLERVGEHGSKQFTCMKSAVPGYIERVINQKEEAQ
jgi:hypothetical protein